LSDNHAMAAVNKDGPFEDTNVGAWDFEPQIPTVSRVALATTLMLFHRTKYFSHGFYMLIKEVTVIRR